MNAPIAISTQHPATQEGALDPLDHLPAGPLTSTELAAAVLDAADRGRYRRIWHGMYRREDQSDDLRLRGRALARTFPDGVLRGRSAALLWGDDAIPDDTLPEIWLPATRKSCPGRVYRYGKLCAEAVTEVGGLRVTTPLRTCRDLAAELPYADAVLAVERMCVARPGLAAQLEAAAVHPSGRGADRFAAVVDAIDPRATSVDISRARILLMAAGFDGFGYEHEVRAGRRMRTLSLADPVARCAVVTSTGGRVPGAPSCDERAWGLLRRAGWTLVVVTGPAATTTPTLDPGGGRIDVAAALRSRWPGAEVLEPLDGEPAADPHGIWAA